MTAEARMRVLVWDLPTRVFHWALAASFAGAYLCAESERWRTVHVALGYAALALIAFRLLWGIVGTRHARFGSFSASPRAAWQYLVAALRGRPSHYTGHNPAGGWAIFALLGVGLATGVTGWLRYEDLGGELVEDAHELLANTWLALVALHVVAVFVSSRLHGENLPRAMLTGYKLGRADEALPGPRRAVGIALGAAVALLVAVTLWAGRPGATGAMPGDRESTMPAGRVRGDD